jgi:transposase
MRRDVFVNVSAADQARLRAVVANGNSRQKHVWRAQILILTASGCGTVEIMHRTGKSKTTVWRWQERFMQMGVDGLLRDKTRPPRVPPLSRPVIERVLVMTGTEPPTETTHWTARAMAAEVGISISSVQRICRATVSRRTASAALSFRMTRRSLTSSMTLLGSTSILRHTLLCSQLTRNRKSRRSIGRSPGYR